jgi:hypothetical protein
MIMRKHNSAISSSVDVLAARCSSRVSALTAQLPRTSLAPGENDPEGRSCCPPSEARWMIQAMIACDTLDTRSASLMFHLRSEA